MNKKLFKFEKYEIDKKPMLSDVVRNEVMKCPEYKRYCEHYKFTDFESDKNIMGFCIWKSFGMSL